MREVDISVIIVNYNVRHFLEPCLNSILKASVPLKCEIWVVDNSSVDGSVEMLQNCFPEVNLLVNNKNLGFSKANNQAIKKAKGKYVLLLNPDTLLQEQTLKTCFYYMESHPSTGVTGVKMIDGTGKYLPESKRGFPSPRTAFFKMIGLNTIFPKSGFFNAYYLGNQSKDQMGPVDVLPGAFMFLSKRVLDQVGYLDEAFFMYGEDIDLSFRVKKAGYSVDYLPTTTIVHYKGESTKKGTLNYVRIFYQAMIIFLEKHYTGRGKKGLVFMLKIAIYAKAISSAIAVFGEKFFFPSTHFLGTIWGLIILKNWWSLFYFKDLNYYNNSFDTLNAPLYAGLWSLSYYLCGLYDSKVHSNALLKGWFLGSLSIGFIYGFLPLEWRNSRMLVVFGVGWSLFLGWFLPKVKGFLFNYRKAGKSSRKPRVLFAGGKANEEKAIHILDTVGWQYEYFGRWGSMDTLPDKIKSEQITDVIFSADDWNASEIIRAMTILGKEDIRFRLFPKDGSEIIGSHSKNTLADLFTLHLNFSIQQPVYRRIKRIFDFSSALLLILLFPILVFKMRSPLQFAINIFKVFIGKKSWVGYKKTEQMEVGSLPIIKEGIFDPSFLLDLDEELSASIVDKINLNYAKDYSVHQDFLILIKNWKEWDRNSFHDNS